MTKSRYEKGDEEARRLVRKSPKKKPPRKDKRRTRMNDEPDRDVNTGDRGDDKDLSLNYKRVAYLYMKKKAEEAAEEETSSGGGGGISGKMVEFLKEEGDQKVTNPTTGRKIKVKSLRSNVPEQKKILTDLFEKWKKSKEDKSSSKKKKPKDEDSKPKKKKEKEEKSPSKKKEDDSGAEKSDSQKKKKKTPKLQSRVKLKEGDREDLKSWVTEFGVSDETATAVVKEVSKRLLTRGQHQMTLTEIDTTRIMRREDLLDPNEEGISPKEKAYREKDNQKKLADALFLRKTVFSGNHLTKQPFSKKLPKSQEERSQLLESHSRSTFDFVHDEFSKEELHDMATNILNNIAGMQKDDPQRIQYEAVLDGIQLSQVIKGHSPTGLSNPSPSFLSLVRFMEESPKHDPWVLIGRAADAPESEIRNQVRSAIHGMDDERLFDLVGGTEGAFSVLIERYGEKSTSEKMKSEILKTMRNMATENFLSSRSMVLENGSGVDVEALTEKELKSFKEKQKKKTVADDFFLKEMQKIFERIQKELQKKTASFSQSFDYKKATIVADYTTRSIGMSMNKKAALDLIAAAEQVASFLETHHEGIGFTEDRAIHVATELDVMSNTLEKVAASWNPEIISEEKSGPKEGDSDESYMGGEFTQQERRELSDLQESGKLGDRVNPEPRSPQPGKQASSLAELKAKMAAEAGEDLGKPKEAMIEDQHSARIGLLSDLSDALLIIASRLDSCNVSQDKVGKVSSSLKKHADLIESAKKELIAALGRDSFVLDLCESHCDSMANSLGEVYPYLEDLVSRCSSVTEDSPTAQLSMREYLDFEFPDLVDVLKYSEKIVSKSVSALKADLKDDAE
jgi:hypothetical protein